MNKIIALLKLLLLLSSFTNHATEKKISVQQLNDNFYLLTGTRMGSNVGLKVSEKGVLLIDAMVKKHHLTLDSAVKAVSNLPVQYVLNTHGDFDHTGANQFFAEHGAEIIAHDNVKFGRAYSQTRFKHQHSLFYGDEQVHFYPIFAHSFSDTVIHFKKSNVIFMGDILANVSHPTFYSGGLAGFTEAINNALSLGDNNTQYIPGHGTVIIKTQLQDYLIATQKWVARVGVLYKAGKSVDDMLADIKLKEIIQRFNGDKLNTVNDKRIKKFIERTLSTEFIAKKGSFNLPISNYTGNYRWQNGGEVNLVNINGSLFLQQLGHSMVHLMPLTKTEFHGRGKLGKKYVFQIKNNKVVGLAYISNGSESLAKRIAYPKVIATTF